MTVLSSLKFVIFIRLFRFSGHEETVGRIANEMGFSHVSLSSQTMPMVRIVPRGYTGIFFIAWEYIYNIILSYYLTIFKYVNFIWDS